NGDPGVSALIPQLEWSLENGAGLQSDHLSRFGIIDRALQIIAFGKDAHRRLQRSRRELNRDSGQLRWTSWRSIVRCRIRQAAERGSSAAARGPNRQTA